jgi:hypothetical protein
MSARRLECAEPTGRCASCDASSDLYVADDPKADVYCRECRSPLTTLDFPEYYCDLGGEA